MLKNTIQSDLVHALKNKEPQKVAAIRFLLAAIQRFEIDTYLPGSQKTLTDEDVLRIIRQQVKQRKESIGAFEKGNRMDLAEKEKVELALIEVYLPAELSDEALVKIAKDVFATGVKEFGPLMGAVMKQVAGRASGDRVQIIVKKLLTPGAS